MTEKKIYSTRESMAESLARDFAVLAKKGMEQKGRFNVVLSGGSTPKLLFQHWVYLVQEKPELEKLFHQIDYFWGDERDVPPDHPQSNYRSAFEGFIKPLHIPEQKIHRMAPERGTLSEAAELYEQELRGFFKEMPYPDFDLVYLGMGTDGHTASLFPDSEALNETNRWVIADWVPKLEKFRITLTFPVINQAKEIILMVAGKDKKEMLQKVMALKEPSVEYPVSMIRPVKGKVKWACDKEAVG